MATEGEEIRYEGGRGGKFQKRSGRRLHTTPYDRPPTLVRNATGNGWLSKLVDPAQKLIASSAHRLFSSVFRKRLPPPPPSLPLSQETKDVMENKNRQSSTVDLPIIQESSNLDVIPNTDSKAHGVVELEQILKGKTFTRSEIDRLTELLNSRIVNGSSGAEERKSEFVPSTPIIDHGRKEESLKIPAQDGIGTPMVSNHVVSPNVLEEDVASPAEIAKAYMGSRPSKTTTSVMVHSQAHGDSFAVSSSPSKSSFLPLVPRSSGPIDVTENGFVTPRSRGRSALYSMARTPYSGVRGAPSIKTYTNVAATTDAYRATPSSSSQSAMEQERVLGSRHGALKRRSFVLDDGMGSGGPMRRIRQKSNLLSSKGLTLPVSGSSTSISVSGIGSETAPHMQSSRVQKLSSSSGQGLYQSETKHGLSRMSAEYEKGIMPNSTFPPIPHRSSEMASKILEQLDRLTPPKEKSSELKLLTMRNNSPMKLSPSMLHGPALKSLEDVDSSKYLENIQDPRYNDARDFTDRKNDKVEESSSLKYKNSHDKVIFSGDGTVPKMQAKGTVSSSSVQVSSTITPSQTKWAFQMSAHEDFVDLDEEGHSNGAVSDVLAEGREKVGAPLVEKRPIASEATAEKLKASVDVKPSTYEINQISDQGKSDVSVTTEKSTGFTFPTAPSPSMTINSTGPQSTLLSEKNVSSELSNATAPVFGFGDKLPSRKESNSPVTFGFGDKSAPANEQNSIPIVTSGYNTAQTQLSSVSTAFSSGDKVTFSMPANAVKENGNKTAVPQFNFASSLVNEKEDAKLGDTSVFKAESSCSPPSSTVSKESLSDRADNKSSSAVLPVGTSVSASTPTSSIFSFGSLSSNSNLNNGSLVSPTPSPLPSPTFTFSNNITNQSSSTKPLLTAATSTSQSVTTASPLSAPVSSFSTGPIFTFASSSVPSTSVSTVSALSAVESVETKTKDSPFGNFGGASLVGAQPKMSSTGSGNTVFQFGAAPAASDGNKSIFPSFGAPVQPASSGFASSTQSMPTQFGSSSSPSFGLAGNTALSSSSSLFSSAPAPGLFNSSTAFGNSSSGTNSFSSSAGTSSSFMNSTWPSSTATATASSFSTAFNSSSPSSGFSFGLTSSNSAPTPFGSSTSASTSSMFSFTSAATAPSSQPAFGNSNQAFVFGSTPTPSVNNDQANMMDSMAEDTVQAVVPTPIFGQQPVSPPPSSGFIFGSPAPAPLAASPFQFGGQPNVPTPQNPTPNPFQASGSLDFNASAGGNFSLGAGGGDKSTRKFIKVKSKSRKK